MKLLAYIICYIIYPFSFLFPRSRRKYAFGSYRGTFADNAKYLFLSFLLSSEQKVSYKPLRIILETVMPMRGAVSLLSEN